VLANVQVLFQDNDPNRFFHQGIDQGDDFSGAPPQSAQFGDDERVSRIEPVGQFFNAPLFGRFPGRDREFDKIVNL
jgi:hypothetical protein